MTEAARFLQTNTSTVSRRVQRVSDMTGMLIFKRSRGGWKITEEGRKLVDLANSFNEGLGSIGELSADAAQAERRVLKLSSLEFLLTDFLSPRIDQFVTSHPSYSLELCGTDASVSLAYGEADVSLRLSRPKEGRLIGRRIATLGIAIYQNRDANADEWVGLSSDLDWLPEMDLAFRYFGKPPALRMSSYESALRAAAATGMATIAPTYRMLGVPMMGRVDSEVVHREVWVVYHETRKNDQAVANIIEWLDACFRQHKSTRYAERVPFELMTGE
ncbi:LysR family transcriptional regulator [Brevirhabdus pacifica]|nr:LysR family transcriptional regulator [Brevirhabdus pacifica]